MALARPAYRPRDAERGARKSFFLSDHSAKCEPASYSLRVQPSCETASSFALGGLAEAPALAQALTLNKADFIRGGARGAAYLACRKAIQEAVARQLALWGDAPEAGQKPRRGTRPVERDLEAVLLDLAEEFPLLAALVERRAGGQKTLPMGRAANAGGEGAPSGGPVSRAAQPEEETGPVTEPAPGETSAPATSEPAPVWAELALPATCGPRRPARYGLHIQFEQRPDDPEQGACVYHRLPCQLGGGHRAAPVRPAGVDALLGAALLAEGRLAHLMAFPV